MNTSSRKTADRMSVRGLSIQTVLWAVLLAFCLSAGPTAAHGAKQKTAPPLGKIVVLIARDQVRQSSDSFRNTEERYQKTLQDAHEILDGMKKDVEDLKKNNRISPYEYEVLSKRYAVAEKDMAGRLKKMIWPGGISHELGRFWEGTVKRTARTGVELVLQPILSKKAVQVIAKLVINAAELKTMIGQQAKGIIVVTQYTEEAFRQIFNGFNDTSRLFRRSPHMSPTKRAEYLREKCVMACDDLRMDCAHRNCRQYFYVECIEECLGCKSRACEYSFSPYWAQLDEAFLSCSGKNIASYYAGIRSCHDAFIKVKDWISDKRLDDEKVCIQKAGESFDKGLAACREKSCRTYCRGDYVINLGICTCKAKPIPPAAAAPAATPKSCQQVRDDYLRQCEQIKRYYADLNCRKHGYSGCALDVASCFFPYVPDRVFTDDCCGMPARMICARSAFDQYLAELRACNEKAIARQIPDLGKCAQDVQRKMDNTMKQCPFK